MSEQPHDEDLPLSVEPGDEQPEQGEQAETPDVEEPEVPTPPQPDDEPVDVVPPVAPPDEQTLDAQADKLGKAAKAYTRKVLDIVGEDLGGWMPCELCAPFAPGLRLPVEVPEQTKEALRVVLGLPGMANYRQDRFSTTCTDCSGQGRVLTGSQVANQSTVQCITCKGTGWVPVGKERQVGEVVQFPVAPPDSPEEVEQAAAAMPPAAVAALRTMLEAAERNAAVQ